MKSSYSPEQKTAAKKKLNIVGIACGALVVLIAAFAIISGNTTAKVGGDVPAEAVLLTGTAQGRNGPVTVTIYATADKIYSIEVTENTETENIGSVAVDELPAAIYEAQSLDVDAISGATITSDAIKAAVANALISGELDPAAFGYSVDASDDNGATATMLSSDVTVANKVETGVHVTVMTAEDWKDEYPNEYATYLQNSENDLAVDYVAEYPEIATLYKGMAFNTYYASARGHIYDITDVTSTGRPHKLANCFTCKTPNFTAMVNEQGDSAYSLAFDDVAKEVTEPISCYNCHANTPGEITVTHTYLSDAMGEDFDKVDAANLSCGQCHVEYYFATDTKATTLPYTNLSEMNPDSILEFYNSIGFTDYTNPDTGVKQIKVQHPEFETFMGAGSPHADTFTCADCHMAKETAEDGTTYSSHYLTSPLDNEELIENTCSQCHADLKSEVHSLQAQVDARTNQVQGELLDLTNALAAAVASGDYTDEQLDQVRSVARDAQFYWDFVFVENSEGAHNPTLTTQCLDKSEELCQQAVELLNSL